MTRREYAQGIEQRPVDGYAAWCKAQDDLIPRRSWRRFRRALARLLNE